MFTGFNLKLAESELDNFWVYKEIGKTHLKAKKAKFEDNISKYIVDGVVDGTKIQKEWFPEIEADIFISHSHKDKDLAIGLSGWLNKEFGLNCFIDSYVWGYKDNLLEIINSKYSDKRKDSDGGYLFNHKKCNIASCHVDMMLSIALQNMIDKTEATILLNTTNSINKYSEVYESETFSPWIYSEIVCTQIIRKKFLHEYRKYSSFYKFANESYKEYKDIDNEFNAVYGVSLEHLNDINYDILKKWKENWSNNAKSLKSDYSLDELYKITCAEKVEKLFEFYNGN